ncbi:phage baseplate assembly protein V [Streptomyces sp. NPDC057301]|uniref:phage baseplate assembly protein V n=1 Tax=Streptomyces sp. NPDC057301 TaxID=3346093 RepID=UPI003638FD31
MVIGHRDPLEEVVEFLYSHFFGKYRGTVVNSKDPTDRGRIRVKVPAVLGDQQVWALPCVPYAGAGVGLYALPEPGTAVWVEFEAGDPSFPVWTGCFWADGELPHTSGPGVKVLRTGRTTLRLDDGTGEVRLANDLAAAVALDARATVEAPAGLALARHVVGGTGVRSESGSGGTVEVSGTGVALNDTALRVG